MYGNQYGIIPAGEQQQHPPPPQYPPPSVPPPPQPASAGAAGLVGSVAGSYNAGYNNPTASVQQQGAGMYGGGFYGQPQAQQHSQQPQQQQAQLQYPSSQYYSTAAAPQPSLQPPYSYGQQQQQQLLQQPQTAQMMYAGGFLVTQQQPPPHQPRTVNVPNPPASSAQQQKQQPQRPRNSYSASMRPPYIDPTTNIIYDVDNPEYEGWLTKQSVWLKEWRRRYFILKGNKLFFCKNEVSGPHGMMDLAHCTTVKSADLKSKKRHSFEISTPDTCYLLYADTESEKDDWIGRVGKAIVRCSRTYYKGDSNQRQSSGGGAGNGYPPEDSDDDDIYENDDPDNPYFND